MARLPRIHVPGGFYHVTLRGNHQNAIFRTLADRALLNTIVAASTEKYGVRVHAYCWMTNHIHLLVETRDKPLWNFMRSVGSGYARAYQRKLDTTGHLFERRYHAILVDTEAYLLEVVRYIHLNPVRAKMVTTAHEYRWSSHHAYTGRAFDGWVTTGTTLGVFAGSRERAVDAYLHFMSVDVESIRSPFENLHPATPFVLGRPEFIARHCEKSPRQQRAESLDALVAEACDRFQVKAELLTGPRRNPLVARARAWIAWQAIGDKRARLAEIARRLDCDPKSLRHAMKRFPDGQAGSG